MHMAAPLSRLRLARVLTFAIVFCVPALFANSASALDELCDSSFQDCRTPLLNMIKAENVAIDVGMWFMEDGRFSAELIRRHQAGVQIRIIMDTRSDEVGHPVNQQILDQLADAGIPMRRRVASGIEHWKVMIFHGTGKLYFGSANFSADAFVPVTPYVNYVDETVYFTDNVSLISSFTTRFEDAWSSTSAYTDYANVTSLARRYPRTAIDPELNFVPDDGEDFIDRSMAEISEETRKIDVMMYRIYSDRAVNTLTSAHNRGIPIRLLVDPDQYRNTTGERYQVSISLDKLFAAGIPMKFTAHQGLNHGKLFLLYDRGLVEFGSSNWTVPSASSQHEHNYFSHNPTLFNWFVDFFERRWNNTGPAVETRPFEPLPPNTPQNQSPSNGASGQSTSNVRLRWWAGFWAHYYDIYFGTSSNPPLFRSNVLLGPSTSSTDYKSFTLPTLQPGTTYYWKIVSKTYAAVLTGRSDLTRTGPVWSFTTAGTPPPPPGGEDIVIWASNIPASNIHGDWARVPFSTAAGNAALQNPDRGRGKIAPALASPANYFEATFSAPAGKPYHLWIRMGAQNRSLSNDSIHVQFSDSVDVNGTPWARIGTTSSLESVLQDGPNGGAPAGWGWTDNGWGALGSPVVFSGSGAHTIRIQQREDGAFVDQIVLSPGTYFSSPPGPRQNDTTILPATDGGGGSPPPTGTDVVLWASQIPLSNVHGDWARVAFATAAGGAALENPDRGRAKVVPALAAPDNYFEATFTAAANAAYHLWIRMGAWNRSLSNDSVHVQFSDSVNAAGAAIARIGTTSSFEPVLQDGPGGAPPASWGWTDNGWGSFGVPIYFASSGTHTIRIQQREDGAFVDQIVLSPSTYLSTPPGPRQNDTTILAPSS